MLTYSEKLKLPEWKTVREATLRRAENKCEDCGATNCHLDTHHRVYDRGKEPWDYPDVCFVCVCRPCHDRREQIATLSRVVFQTMEPEAALKILTRLVHVPGKLTADFLIGALEAIPTDGVTVETLDAYYDDVYEGRRRFLDRYDPHELTRKEREGKNGG